MSPEIVWALASGAGAAAGVTADYIAVQKAQRDLDKEPLQLDAVTEAVNVANESIDSKNRQYFSRLAGSVAMRSALALSIASFAGIEAYSLDHPKVPSAKANIELAIDDSGSVVNVLPQEVKIVSQFDETNPDAVVGNVSMTQTLQSKNFANFVNTINGVPAGDSLLNNQVTIALDNVAKNSAKTKGNNTNSGGEVVLITNGNSAGDVQNLENQAKTQKTKVYVVNIERNGTNPKLITDLNSLAKKTGGKFWNANSANLNSVAKDVKASANPPKEHIPEQDQWPYRVSGLFGLLCGISIYKNRRLLITGKNPKGE